MGICTAAIANTCSTDLKFCNDTQICIQATRGVGKKDLANKVRLEPNRVWSTAPLYTHFVKAAKARGLDCGVKKQFQNITIEARYSCLQNLDNCSNELLCKVATKGSDGYVELNPKKPRWNQSLPHHVAEAKKRGLDCGTKTERWVIKPTPNTKPASYYDFLREIDGNWSGKITCSNKVYPFTGKLIAKPGNKRLIFHTDNFTYEGNFSINNFKSTIMTRATRNDGENFNETLHYSRKSQTFTGKTSRGCLVDGKKSLNGQNDLAANNFAKSDFYSLNLTQRKQFQYALKQLGYYTSSVDGLYGPKTENAAKAYAQAKGIKNGYPDSLYRQLVSEVNVPSSFAIAKKPQKARNRTTQSETNSNVGQAIVKGLAATLACSLTPNPSACLSGVAGNKPTTSNGQSVDVFSNDNSCSRDGNCGYNEFCAKKPGMTRGECMGKPSGVGRNWSPVRCTRDTQCPVDARCDRTYKICVERW